MIPLPDALREFLLAFGAALFLANALAIVRLHRDRNWPPYRPVGMSDAEASALSRAALREQRIPSRPRILIGLIIGLAVSLYALVSLVSRGSAQPRQGAGIREPVSRALYGPKRPSP